MLLGIRPTVDFVFKMLFGSPANSDLLIHLLNAVLQPDAPIVDVVILNPFNEKEFEGDKLSVVDLKARDSSGRWFVIEMQTTLPLGLRNHRERIRPRSTALWPSLLVFSSDKFLAIFGTRDDLGSAVVSWRWIVVNSC